MSNEVKKDINYLLCYTRKTQDELIYSDKLAYSMHLAYSRDGKKFNELNHNSGVLFAKATENGNGSLNAKSLKNPYIFNLVDGKFGVVAIRTEWNGENDSASKGKVLLFTSADLISYDEIGFIDLRCNEYVTDITCDYNKEKDTYIINWKNEKDEYYSNTLKDFTNLAAISKPVKTVEFNLDTVDADIEGIVPRNIITVSEEVLNRVTCKLTVPMNIKIDMPESITVKSEEELEKVKAVAHYTDGTKTPKEVDWDTSTVDWHKNGTYRVKGQVHQDHYAFPIAIDRADPCIGKWNGKYYFIATNDADGNHSLYMREADNIPDLLSAEEVLLIDSNMYEDIGGLLWAPEFHIIENDLYIFHGATRGEFFYEESHVMKLRKGGNPMNKEDWSRPHRVVKKDGSFLCEAGKTISLDMTCFEVKGEYYIVWSQREFIPVDLGAWLYIAKVDPKEPWKLITDPIVLTKPEYGWENNHVFVAEGPFALIKDGKVYLTYSGALIDATYVVGLLKIDINDDLLNPQNWTKGNYPLLSSRSVPGEYGPGHNSYVIDDNGDTWNAYHGKPGIDGPRSSGLRRVHYDIDGEPMLDLTEDRDLNSELKEVEIEVKVIGG